MILHQSVGVEAERESAFTIRKIGEKLIVVLLITKDALLSIPPCDDMVQCPRKMDSRFACHDHSLSRNAAYVNTVFPLPDPTVFSVPAFLIFDEAIKKQMEKKFDHVSVVFPFTKAENFDALLKGHLDKGFKEVFVADSLEGLASKTGIDAEGLKRTVNQYNRFCEKGHDDIFNKRYELLRPIKTPKFYAARFLPGAYGSLGGIKINHEAEVLNKDWKKIPGLYAAGTDACSIYGDSYVFVLPGNTMGFALNTGRIAGENAAPYVKSRG